MKLEPAALAFDANGTPWSSAYGDVYHSADSGPGQARHVFIGGNGLPANWAGRRSFTIIETGFGLGINFLATWQAWRDDPARPQRLHYVSIEKHPFRRDDLVALHQRYAEFSALAAQLHAAWPLPLAGTHRLHFDDEGVTLTLVFDDVAHALPRLRGGADAFYLDGFSPQKNADMWSPRVMQTLARLARPGATLATYTTARAVKDALAQAGFAVERRAGFGRKRDMLCARYQPRWQPRHAPPAVPAWPRRHAIVIGAGIAGTAVVERLAQRGWSLDLIERHAAVAGAASGMHAGAFHPLLARDDSHAARLSRAGFFYALQRWQALDAAGHTTAWQRCGALQLAGDDTEESHMAETVRALNAPPAYAQFVDRDEARRLAGVALHQGGYWFAQGGWMRAASLAAANLAAAAAAMPLRLHFNTEVAKLVYAEDEWQALNADGDCIATAPVVILANAGDAAQLVDFAHPLQNIRGQVACVPAAVVPGPRAVITGSGYLLPAIDGVVVAGASYDLNNADPLPHAAGRAQIAAQMAQMLDGDFPLDHADGRVGFRCVAVDHLPLAGAVADVAAARANAASLRGVQPDDLPRLRSMYAAIGYGSRGLIWSGIAAELIASQIEGEPAPLESDLLDAIDPGRFTMKRLRHGAL